MTSISKLYGVAIYEIAAANKDIVDVDLVFEGQHLNIPLSTAVPLQMVNGFKSTILSITCCLFMVGFNESDYCNYQPGS